MTLLGGPPAGDPVVAATSDEAYLLGMLAFEVGLAGALVDVGVVGREAAAAVADACDPAAFDVAQLAAAAAASGTPVLPLVEALRARVGEAGASALHRGATSQDVVDTATMLVARGAVEALLEQLEGVAELAAALAAEHARTPALGRTLLQPATPVTFGLKAAGWLVALDEAAARLEAVADERLAVQLGGGAGTLDGLGADGPRVVAAHATRLGLTEPVLPWHTDRTRVAELAGALASAAGVLGKVALDLVLLAQAEVAEATPRTGGRSSAMAHKRNPADAVRARAFAARAPQLAATLLAAMPQEHERAAGAWQSEWATLRDLLRVTGVSATAVGTALADLELAPDHMAATLEASPAGEGSVGSAEALVALALAAHAARTRGQAPRP